MNQKLDPKMKDSVMALLERTKNIIVCSQNEADYPNAKAMFKTEYDDLKTFYFSTNVSAKRTQQFSENPKASIYFFDGQSFQGLMLVGEMTVCMDRENRERLWHEGDEMYYPQGIDDPDYCVLKFEAKTGNYYHGLSNIDFTI